MFFLYKVKMRIYSKDNKILIELNSDLLTNAILDFSPLDKTCFILKLVDSITDKDIKNLTDTLGQININNICIKMAVFGKKFYHKAETIEETLAEARNWRMTEQEIEDLLK